MAFTEWIALAVLQALAEVLPIGAIGQLSFVNAWSTVISGPIYDLSLAPAWDFGVRLGLALGAAAYFWQDIADMMNGLARMAKGKRDSGARLAFLLIFATIPSIGVAFAIQRVWGTAWHSDHIIAWAAFAVGLLLLIFDSTCMTVKRVEHAGYGDALLLGLAQAAAFVPGVGRIAATTAMARLLGYERQDAARFSFLMSIPVLLAGTVWHAPHVAVPGERFPTTEVLIGAVIAFLVAIALLAFLMNWLRRRSFAPFAIYRVALGINLLVLAYGVF